MLFGEKITQKYCLEKKLELPTFYGKKSPNYGNYGKKSPNPADSNLGTVIGPNDPISYTMIVPGLLNLFSAILDFSDPYHALATVPKFDSAGFGDFFPYSFHFSKKIQKCCKL